MPLTDAEIRTKKSEARAFKLFDGGGLFLLVHPKGAKSWYLVYRAHGVQRKLSLGRYPAVSLGEARLEREKTKLAVNKGKDPWLEQQLAKEEAERRKACTFEGIGREWLARIEPRLKPKSYNDTLRLLESHIFPSIGHLDIADIEASTVLKVLERIRANGGLQTPHVARATCSRIFRFAVATKRADRDPCQLLGDALPGRPQTKNHPKLGEKDLPEFFARLARYGGFSVIRDALTFVILTAVRPDEARFGLWSEIEVSGDEWLWRIPPERMKAGREHLVPLSRQAVKILEGAKARYPSELLFPSVRSQTSFLGQNSMLAALQALNYHGTATVHGFRGTFSTILNEREYNRDWIEAQLAHHQGGVRGAYNSAQYLRQRREMMQWWADFLTEKGLIV